MRENPLVENRKAPKTGMPTSGLAIFVGYPKSGKTTLASSFPDSYVLELEKGGGDRVDGRIHEINDLASFRKILPVVIKEPSIKTIVIDTIDVVSDWIEAEIAKEKGLDTMTDRKEGVNGFELWGTFKKRMESLSLYFKNCGKLVILIAHTRDAKQDGDGNVIAPAGINVPGKSGGFIAAQADMIGYCLKKEVGSGMQFYVSFRGGPLGQWGSRVSELNGKILLVPAKNQYTAFSSIFKTNGNGSAKKKTTKKVTKKSGEKS